MLGGSATISSGASLSNEIFVGGRLAGLTIPASWTAASITFTASQTSGGTFTNLVNSLGSEVTVTVTAGTTVSLALDDFAGVSYIKIRSGTSATPVNQGADRVIGFSIHDRDQPLDHETDTTNIHGIANTAQLATLNTAQTITGQKTFAATVLLGASGDVNLYRPGADILKTDDLLIGGGMLRRQGGFQVQFASGYEIDLAGSFGRLASYSAQNMGLFSNAYWGGGAWQRDTTTLAAGKAEFGTHELTFSNVPAGANPIIWTERLKLEYGASRIVFQGDTNLYRDAADTLKTDDNFVIAGTLNLTGQAVTFGAADSAGAGFRQVRVPN